MTDSQTNIHDELARLAAHAPEEELIAFLNSVHPADIADALYDLPDPLVERVFLCLNTEAAADVLAYMDNARAADVLPEVVPPERLSEILEEMDSDDAADFIGTLDRQHQEELLELMEAPESGDVQTLLEYPPDSAGGLMSLEFFAVPADATVDQAIEAIRAHADVEFDGALYVVDEQRHLLGRVPLRELVLRPGDTRVGEILEDVVSVPVDMDQEEVARTAERYDLSSVPVVDAENHLLGRITIDDIVDVIHDETSEDIFKMAGSGADELSARTTLSIVRLRLPWLVVTMLAGLFGSATVIHLGQIGIKDAELFAALAPFFPVLMGLGGNTGMQSSTIITRTLALQPIRFDEWLHLLWRELRVGLLLGLVFGVVVGGFAFALEQWQGSEGYGPFLGVVVTGALWITIPLSCVMGATLPILMRNIGVDPAIAAGPFLTMSNDLLSLIVYFLITLSLLHLFA